MTPTTAPAVSSKQIPRSSDWREHALCAQTDPEAFFPNKGDSGEQAKRVCADCPVTSECLAWALAHRIPFGIWGGLSVEQRRRLQRGQAPRRTAAQDAEIARRTAAGQSAPQIAQALDLTVRSVHRARARCSSQS